MPCKIGWFSTGRDKAARDLLQAVQERTNAEIAFVFSNRARGQDEEADRFFELVENYKIDLLCFPSKGYKPELRKENSREWRRQYDREVVKRIAGYEVELDVLAGYMLIVGQKMAQQRDMINLHPAAPSGPKGTWQEVIWKLIESKADYTGVTIHLVTEVLDEGPPITYCRFKIKGEGFDEMWKDLKDKPLSQVKKDQGEGNPLFRKIRKEGLKREIPLLVETVNKLADGEIKLKNRKVVAKGKSFPDGYNLTEKIDSIVKRKHDKP